MNNIIKRDGTSEAFNINKIINALNNAFKNTNVICDNFNEIISHINNEITLNSSDINIETIQDIVEKSLMIYKYYDTAKHYINYRAEHNKNRNNISYLSKIKDNIKTPWGMLGYITYKRTYARRLNLEDDNDETTEEYRDTILRVLQGCQQQLNVNFSNNELDKAYKYLMELKCSVAGRFLWQLGTETITKQGIMSLQNCAFVKIDEPIKPFLWIFDVLMLGTGVGFNIQQDNINKLPPVINANISIIRKDTKDADFIIPDSREGWVSLLEKVLESYFYKGNSFSYSTILIRSAGTKIKGFGGVASGPEDLVKGINQIQGILNNKKGKQLTSVDCLDIVNIIASVVVAGNVRRCIPVGSKVHTKNGLINIEDIVIGDEVFTTKGYKKVKNVFNQGHQDIFKIDTDYTSFKCTKNHKMPVYNENNNSYSWVIAEKLKKGDKLILTKTKIEGNSNIKLPSFNFTNRKDRIICPDFNYDIAYLFGYISNNCYSNDKDKSLIINCSSLELLTHIKNIIDKFGPALRLVTDIDKNNNIFTLKIISTNFYSYIKLYLINNIPYFINETSYNNRIGFIIGILESNKCKIIENSIIIENLSSEYYIKELSNILYSCGFVNKINNSTIIIDDILTINKLKQYNLISKSYPNININIDINNNKIINDINIEIATVKDNISYDDSYLTYDIEVDEIHEFFCNGFLTHNSALICLGDYDDIDYLNAKRWDLGNIPNWRCMSNNSVVCNDINKLPNEFWNGYNGNGEPYGLVNIDLSRKIGRIKDGDKYPDPDVEGYNPCLTDDTIIMTDKGLIRIKDLIGKKFNAVINGNVYESTDKGFWYSGNKEVYLLKMSNGIEIKATENHKFKTLRGWKEVREMNDDDVININSNYKYNWGSDDLNTFDETEGYILGQLINNYDEDSKDNSIMIYSKNSDYTPLNKILEYCDNNYKLSKNGNWYKIKSYKIEKLAIKYNTDSNFYNNDYLITNASYSKTIGILRAIFDIYSHIINNNIILRDLNIHKLKIIQQMLFSLGINNKINNHNNELYISNITIFKNIIGYYDNKKKYILNNSYYDNYKENFYLSRIVNIIKLDNKFDVYDCTINDIHSFSANSLISHNCAEQSLANYETCCLSEIYLCNINNYEELKEIATIVYRICKHSLLLKCHQKATEEIVHKNLRMGIGITGYLQSSEEQKNWLNDLYEYLREYDNNYSKKIGVPTSVKLTTVKPSGTLSLLAGVTSGAHPAIYQYFIRRIRISSSNTSLLELAKNHHYYIEYQKNFDGTDDKNTMIIEFPCCYPEGTILAKDMSAIDQLNTIKDLQTRWSDNSVSVTIYYRLEELEEIKEWLKNNYNYNIKTCSFLLHNEHGFKQAPFEEITKEKYEELLKKVIPITSGKINVISDNELTSDCVGGSCPIR
jgi:ribonucleotide reductase alpha subunit